MQYDDQDLEFGVPFPGLPLPKEQWTQTGIKRLPTTGHLEVKQVFGRAGALALDLGCGNGRSTILLSYLHPELNWLGIDVLPLAIRYAIRRANQRGRQNVRFAVADARELMLRLIAPHSIAEIHFYHPQPYYDLAQAHKRLVTPEWLAWVYQALVPDGRFYVQTDNPGYWRYIKELLPMAFQFEERFEPWPWAKEGISRREILARQQQLPIYRGVAVPLSGLTCAGIRSKGEQLPPPVFDADRRLRALEQQEQRFNSKQK